jgi:hypothetical protein
MSFLTMLGTIISALALLAAIVVGWQQLSELRNQLAQGQQQLEEARRREYRDNALKYSFTKNPDIRQARDHLLAAFPAAKWKDKPIPIEELDRVKSKKVGDEGYFNELELDAFLNHWENMAKTIYAQTTDEDFAFEMLATTVVLYVKEFRPYIEQEQQKYGPRVYCYLVQLADRWEERLKKQGNKPFFTLPP